MTQMERDAAYEDALKAATEELCQLTEELGVINGRLAAIQIRRKYLEDTLRRLDRALLNAESVAPA